MKHQIYYPLLILLVFSCDLLDPKIENALPSCIQELIDEDSEAMSIKTIKTQEIDGVVHFWINTDAMHFDGVEVILSETCSSLCFFCGECLLPPCIEDYDEEWETLWVR